MSYKVLGKDCEVQVIHLGELLWGQVNDLVEH